MDAITHARPRAPHPPRSDGDATPEDGATVLERGELARARFVELLGMQRVGDRRIRVRLAGDGGGDKFPHVDPETGDVVLYRFPGERGGYEASRG